MANYPNQIDGRNLEAKLRELTRPFVDEEIQWRTQSVRGTSAMLLAYVDARAIFDRLDSVVGPQNWQTNLKVLGNKNLAGIGIRIAGEWVWKWDGAGDTKVEAEKGGISSSLKRAAVLWGMARHLYSLGATWADVLTNKPKSIPPRRIVYIKKGQWCVAPSIRDVQMDIMSIDDATRHLGAKARRIARFTEVAKRLNIPREEIPNMYEATSAQWKEGFPTKKGAPHPRTASDKQLQIASQNAVKWFEDGTLVEKIHEYNKKFGVKNGVSQ